MRGCKRIALVAHTAADARDVMVEGESGLLSVCSKGDVDHRGIYMGRPIYQPSKRRIIWANGAIARTYSGDKPDQLRGPQHDFAWADELCLVAGTMIAAERGAVPIEAIAAGERVWTRSGLRNVRAAWQSSQSAEVYRLTLSDGRSIVGTASHPIYSAGQFVPLASLASGAMVSVWQVNEQSGAAKLGISTEIITETEKANCCIGKNTKMRLAQFLPMLMSIISTGIRKTTSLKTFRQYPAQPTFFSMSREALLHGDLSSAAKTQSSICGGGGSLLSAPASIVARASAAKLPSPYSARQSARPETSGSAIPDMTELSVLSVERLSAPQAVYNFEVEGKHEYFANGILTHNCKWRYGDDAWSNLLMGLRLGLDPRVVATTTPRPIKLLMDLVKEPTTAITKASTYENKQFLADTFLTTVVKRYEGTRLGAQELLADMLIEVAGALWSRDMIEKNRVRTAPETFERIVIAVDPAVSSNEKSDEHGIMVCAKGHDGKGYLLEDLSMRGTPDEWGRAVIRAYDKWKADKIVAEVNQGGEMVELVIRTTARNLSDCGYRLDPHYSYKGVHASRGKAIRAEPISALYEQGIIRHVGLFAEVEDQMCSMTPDFDRNAVGYSPDRLDALVWGFTELFLGMKQNEVF